MERARDRGLGRNRDREGAGGEERDRFRETQRTEMERQTLTESGMERRRKGGIKRGITSRVRNS